MKTVLVIMTFVLAVPGLAQTTDFQLVTDVPTDVASDTFVPWEIVARNAGAGTYGSVLVLPGTPPPAGLHRLDGGDWLLSLAAPWNLGGVDYETRDIVRYDGATYSMFFDGSANGVPSDADIDGLFLDGGDAGDPIVSFGVPASIDGTTYQPGDLVRLTAGSASLFFDGASAGLPAGSNVVGADEHPSGVALTFDVPTNVSGTDYLPGQIVTWNGSGFSLLHSDSGWPLSSQIFGFTLQQAGAASPGVIPPTLTVTKISDTVLNLAWSASCGSGSDYGIYEGQIGSWYSHTQVDCSDDGADLNEDLVAGAGNRYMLVVPHDASIEEGSYGLDSSANERPVGSTTCHAAQALAPCP